MRIKLQIDDELVQEVARVARETDRTKTAVIEDAIRQLLARYAHAADRPGVKLKTLGKQRLEAPKEPQAPTELFGVIEAEDPSI